MLILEELEHAQKRGAHVYCEVAGYANRSNGYHMTGLRPDGAEMALAISAALSQGRQPAGRLLHQRPRLSAPARTTGT